MTDMNPRGDEPPRMRVPPHSIEAEQSLLGAMLLSEHAVSAVANIVTADDFYKPAHRHIFEAIQALYGVGQGVDPVTVADELANAGVLDVVGGSGTLVSLQAGTPAITNAEHYARIVEEKALLRRLIITANDVAELGYSPLDDIEKTIDSAESLIFAVAQRRTTDTLSELSPLLDRSLEQLEMLYERGDAITGTPSGYTDLDHMLAGLQPGALIVVGARPAMGKCLAWDTEVVDPGTGALVTMERAHLRGRLGASTPVLSLGEDLRLRTSVPSDHIDDGVKPVVRVTTALGRTVRCTWTHPFRTLSGWQPLASLDLGDRIAVPRRLPVFGDREQWDGTLAGWVAALAGHGPGSRLPADAFELPRHQMARLIGLLLDAAGSVSVSADNARYGFSSVSERLARDVQHLLLRFGVIAGLSCNEGTPGRPPTWELGIEHGPSVRALASSWSPSRTARCIGWRRSYADRRSALQLGKSPPAEPCRARSMRIWQNWVSAMWPTRMCGGTASCRSSPTATTRCTT